MIGRNIEKHCRYLLKHFPAIVILGPRQVGKTMLATQLGQNWTYFDLENPENYERIATDPALFFKQYTDQVIIDEAQFIPAVFNALRGVIDANRQKMGRFILTGSSSPELLKQTSESLAGRVAIVELGTLKANEFYEMPLSPLYALFESKINKESVDVLKKKSTQPLQNIQMVHHWLQGGYPEPILAKDKKFYHQWMDAYRNSYVNRDIGRLFPRLNKIAYQRFLTTLSQLSGTIINKSQLARNIEIDEKTVREYLTIAEGTFLWRMLYSYENNVTKSIVKMPKGYIRDSGLLNYLLRIHDLDDLYQHPQVGNLFEAFVIDEIIKGLNAQGIVNYQANYYRTRNDAEVDLVLEGFFGVVPIEIKYGTTVRMNQLVSMKNFIKEHNLPLGVVINQADRFEWITDNIIQIPVGWL
ncbi:MAG: ATP-binding protein [Pseudomonadota bacterium]